MTGKEKGPKIERRFKDWLNRELEEAETTSDQVRLVKAKYLDLMDGVPIAEVRRHGLDNNSLKEIFARADFSFKLLLLDPPLDVVLNFGSILLARDWLETHPASEQTLLVSRQGDNAPFSSHASLYINFLCEVVFPSTKSGAADNAPWKQH